MSNKASLEFPPIPAPKRITESDIDITVKDVIRNFEDKQGLFSNQAETSLDPNFDALIQSSSAVITERLKKTPLYKAKHALRHFTQQVILTTSSLYLMLSSGCGNVDSKYVFPPTRTPEPLPTSTPLLRPPRPPTELPSLIPSTAIPTFTEKDETSSYLESTTLDGMETYGINKSITQIQLEKLYDNLNSVELEMRNDTYYGTIFIKEGYYKFFHDALQKKGKTIQEWLKIQEAGFNQLVHDQPYPDTNKLRLRRLIVVDDAVVLRDLWGGHMHEINRKIKDSDGGWNLSERYNSWPPNPLTTKDDVNLTILHEWGHSILHLPDQYGLNFEYIDKSQIPKSLADHETDNLLLFTYSNFHTNPNLGKPLMSAGIDYSKTEIGLHSNLQLMRRIKRNDVHNIEKTLPEVFPQFPYEIPESTTFSFGKEYANAKVNIFRTTFGRFVNSKGLISIGSYNNTQNGDLIINKSNMFAPKEGTNFVEAPSGTILLQIITSDNKYRYRWFDIRDFNIPYWQGFENHVTMNFKLTSDEDNPIGFNWENFDWTIKYSP